MPPRSALGPHTAIPYALAAFLIAATACQDSRVTAPIPLASAVSSRAPAPSTDISVSSLGELYAAVNNPANAGKRVVVSAGTYALDAAAAGGVNGGRLELQNDMSLVGASGHADDVIIDGTHASYTAPRGVTGAISIGRGTNSVEALTVRNANAGAAGIITDLVAGTSSHVRIAGVVATNSQRGIDIRNVVAGHAIEADLVDNDLYGNNTGNGQGVRFVNTGANGATIHAVLQRNSAHNNFIGCLAANLNSSDATITIESQTDRFEGNGNGCILLGGNSQAAGVPTNRNVIDFQAHASRFSDNTGVRGVEPFPAGLLAIAGTSIKPNTASDNHISIETWGVKMGGNGGPDIAAWGARATVPAGTNDVVDITIHGKPLDIVATNSTPADPSGTNKVIVH